MKGSKLARASALGMFVAAAALSATPSFACSAVSGHDITPVVELFTSEGCDSCPPADRWLSSTFPPGAAPGGVIALAFHVDYWDRLGWTDRFARPEYTARQHEAMQANGARFVFTPQVLVQGHQADWRGARVRERIAAMTGRAAEATLTMVVDARADGVDARVDAELANGRDRDALRVILAYADSGLTSQVTAGENRGARLVHDHVVRALHEARVRATERRTTVEHMFRVPAEPGSRATVVALVEDTRTGDILQALAVPVCLSSAGT